MTCFGLGRGEGRRVQKLAVYLEQILLDDENYGVE
jgi:hypothetical protein